MATVRLENITKTFEENNSLLKSVSFEVLDGEFLAIVGPSGCGKSTLLRIIAGLETISGGELYIDDVLMNHVSPKDRDIAMVFQNYALYPNMSVRENIAFGLKLKKLAPDEIEIRVKEAAGLLGLSDYLDRLPKALSGGQRQRVAVARAIVRKPKIFLFDEPLSNLDLKLRVQMRNELTKVQRALKATMIYVTHDHSEAMIMGDRVVVMNEGTVQQIDTPAELYQNPTNKFVAEFIGNPAMNFMQGEIQKIADKYAFVTKGGRFLFEPNKSITDNLTTNLLPVVLGIRPEHLEVFEHGESPKDYLTLSTEIDEIEHYSTESFIYCTVNDNAWIARTTKTQRNSVSDPITLGFKREDIYMFNAETGTRI